MCLDHLSGTCFGEPTQEVSLSTPKRFYFVLVHNIGKRRTHIKGLWFFAWRKLAPNILAEFERRVALRSITKKSASLLLGGSGRRSKYPHPPDFSPRSPARKPFVVKPLSPSLGHSVACKSRVFLKLRQPGSPWCRV